MNLQVSVGVTVIIVYHFVLFCRPGNQNNLLFLNKTGRLEKTTRSSQHHVAQHRPTRSETTPPYAPRSSRFGSEPPSVEDDANEWCYACRKRRQRQMQYQIPPKIVSVHLSVSGVGKLSDFDDI